MATLGRPNVKGLTRKDSIQIGIRVTPEMDRKLRALARDRELTVSEVFRLAAEMAIADPGAFARGMVATAYRDFGGPDLKVTREVVDQVALESAGQLRLVDG